MLKLYTFVSINKFFVEIIITLVNIYNYIFLNFIHHLSVCGELNSLFLKKELKLFNIFVKSLTITQNEN